MKVKNRTCKNCKHWRQIGIFKEGGSCLRLTIKLLGIYAPDALEDGKFDSWQHPSVSTGSKFSCNESEPKKRNKTTR